MLHAMTEHSERAFPSTMVFKRACVEMEMGTFGSHHCRFAPYFVVFSFPYPVRRRFIC